MMFRQFNLKKHKVLKDFLDALSFLVVLKSRAVHAVKDKSQKKVQKSPKNPVPHGNRLRRFRSILCFFQTMLCMNETSYKHLRCNFSQHNKSCKNTQ
jgi:hypothetical protein